MIHVRILASEDLVSNEMFCEMDGNAGEYPFQWHNVLSRV